MKTKHRILSVLTVLALVASLTAVTAAPAAATPGGAVVSVSPATALKTANYTISFFAPAKIPVGGAILVTFPTGTGNLTVLADTIPPAANLTVAGVTANITDIAAIGMTIAVTTNVTIHVGSAVVLGLRGIINPGPGRHTLTVAGITSGIYHIYGLARTPASGAPGTMVTLSGLAVADGAPGTLAANVTGVITPVAFTTDAVGTIPPTVVPILADAPTGNVTFIATVGGVPYTSPIFTVLPAPPVPTITVSPTSGLRGTNVTVTGTGFPVNAAGIITAPGVILPETFTTNATGGFTDNVTILKVPPAPLGLQTITATVGVVSATAHFVVMPPPVLGITLAPISGARSINVTVNGTGFPPLTPGAITAPGVIAPVTFNSTAAGAVPPTIVTILPGAPFGPATITVTVGVVSATATFTVTTPAITLVPIGGVPGANVTVTGVGFPLGLSLGDGTITAPGVIAPTPFATNATGAIYPTITVTILVGAPPGPVTFTAATIDPPGPPLPVTATATYTVGIPASITLTPAIGFPGTNVTVAGFGFPPGKPITITAPPGVLMPPPPPPVKTTAAGTIPAVTRIIAVGAPVGEQTITVTVAGVTATANFTVAGVLPPVIVVPPVPVLEGLEVIWGKLGKSVWHFRAGEWFQYHTVPEIHELIPVGQRLAALEVGQAYWIYLEKPITDVLVGGKRRTLPAGWHNIGWIR